MDAYDVGWLAGIIDGEGSAVLVQGSAVRKTDGRRPISPRVLMCVTDFHILHKYTTLLTQWGVRYTYIPQYVDTRGDRTGKITVTVHRIDSVITLLDIIIPHLSLKKERAQLVRELAAWKLAHREDMMRRYKTLDPAVLDAEQEFWTRYREIYAGRGGKLFRERNRDLREAVIKADTPIYFPD